MFDTVQIGDVITCVYDGKSRMGTVEKIGKQREYITVKQTMPEPGYRTFTAAKTTCFSIETTYR